MKSLRNNLGNLHILRGICALYVVVYHAKFIFWSGGTEYIRAFPMDSWGMTDKIVFGIDMLSSAGREMVYIFFLLSGFFISLSISSNNYSYFKFIQVRFTRIYIPFLFSLLLGGCLFLIANYISPFEQFENSIIQLNMDLYESHNNFGFLSILKSLFMHREGVSFFAYNNVYWSLAYELLFYILIGFCMTKGKRMVLVGFFILLYALNYVFHFPLIGRINLSYFSFFGIGILLHLLVAKYEDLLVSRKLNKFLTLLVVIGSFLGLLFFLKIKEITILVELLTIFLSVSSMYFLLFFDLKESFVKKMFIYLGEVSYSLYLGHIPYLILGYSILFYLTGKELIYTRIYYWVATIFVVPLSLVVYYAAEKPSMRFLRKIKKG